MQWEFFSSACFRATEQQAAPLLVSMLCTQALLGVAIPQKPSAIQPLDSLCSMYQQMRRRLRYSTTFCLSLHWQPLSSPLPGWRTARWGPEGQNPSHCKGRPGSGPPEELEHTHVYGTWRDASQNPDRTGWCSCQATPHDICKVTAVRWSVWWLEKRKHCAHFWKGRKEEPGTTDPSASPMCLGRSRNRSS